VREGKPEEHGDADGEDSECLHEWSSGAVQLKLQPVSIPSENAPLMLSQVETRVLISAPFAESGIGGFMPREKGSRFQRSSRES
jgi:hypothetical protein